MKLTLGLILPFALTLVLAGAARLGLGPERGSRLAGGAVVAGFILAWAITWRPGWMPADPFSRIGHIALGALLMGVLVGLLAVRVSEDGMRLRLLLGVGVLGGFTTFSTFSIEAVSMLERRAYGTMAAYVVGSAVFSILAVMLGLLVARKAWS